VSTSFGFANACANVYRFCDPMLRTGGVAATCQLQEGHEGHHAAMLSDRAEVIWSSGDSPHPYHSFGGEDFYPPPEAT
jgi:hypothetical protein